MTPRSLLAFCREKNVEAVEIRYTRLGGHPLCLQLPVGRLSESLFETGIQTYGPVERAGRPGYLLPLADTAYLAPLRPLTTIAVLAELQDAVTLREDACDSRCVLTRAGTAWTKSGFGDQLLISQSVTWRQPADRSTVVMNSVASSLMQEAANCNLDIEQIVFDSSQTGFLHIALPPAEPTRAGDQFLLLRQLLAAQEDASAARGDHRRTNNASLSCWQVRLNVLRENQAALAGGRQFGLNSDALSMAAGVLAHLPAIIALSSGRGAIPRIANAYADKKIAISPFADTAVGPIRVLAKGGSDRSQYLGVSVGPPTANVYLGLASIIMAAAAGIEENRTVDEAGALEGEPSAPLPASADEAITAVEGDNQFLLANDVFSPILLKRWAELHKPKSR